MSEEPIRITYFIISFIFHCIIAYYIIKTARKTKLNQLYLLATHVFLEGFLQIIMAIQGPYGEVGWFYFIEILVLVVFMKWGFYKEQRSISAYVVIVISIVNYIIYIPLIVLQISLAIRRFIIDIIMITLGSWFLYVSLSAYLKIRSVKGIEPWIKARYVLVMIYGFLWALSGVFLMIPGPTTELSPLILLTMLLYIIIPVTEYLAWVMPERFKNWLNRNYTYEEETGELSEEEIMKSFGGD
ncbi:MAG: hypothetical protein ACFFAS_11140 [Promethearchaeota archaeon]